MKYACLLILFLLAACGAEKTPTVPSVSNIGNTNSAPQANEPVDPARDTWDSIPEPVVDTERAWLRVEAAAKGEDYRWSVNGQDTDVDSMQRILTEYAEKIDHGANMKGAIADGISANPVVFSAGPEVTSQAFYAMLELIVSARLYRFIVELNVEGQSPRRIWQTLPHDRGLELESDGDALPDPREFMLTQNKYKFYLKVRRDERNYDYIVSTGSKDRRPVPDTLFSLDDLLKDGWNEALYRDRRKALAKELLTSQGTGEDAKDVFEITPMGDILADKLYAHWAPVFLAIDAADLANNAPDRGDCPQLFTMFRFTDALELYK